MKKNRRFAVLVGLLLAAGAVLCQDEKPTQKELDKLQEEMKQDLGEGYRFDIVEGLFVCGSNSNADEFGRAKGTITHVQKAMEKDFVSKKLTKPMKVYLFRDARTYEKFCKDVLKSAPSTPFGFYLSGQNKMVMNLSTGTGTLAHELVHAFIMNDFPDIPTWFNEGFASLFEQSTYTDDGSLKGLVNWRLPKLQEELDKISLETLMKTSNASFMADSELNYASARYLCLYLQEQGKLKDFYAKFHDRYAQKKDTTGIETLEDVLGIKLADVEKKWKPWVKALKRE